MDSKMGYESTDSKITPLDIDSMESNTPLDIEPSIIECTICFINEQNKILPCEHKVCEGCYQNIDVCPFCRKNINKPRPESRPEPRPLTFPVILTNTITNSDEESIYDICVKIRFYLFITIVGIVPMAWISYGLFPLYRTK
jgi:hypothetical protein